MEEKTDTIQMPACAGNYHVRIQYPQENEDKDTVILDEIKQIMESLILEKIHLGENQTGENRHG